MEIISSSGSETDRECGSCKACCEGWMGHEALDMYPGKACSHLTAKGCGIYATRPQDPCRSFICSWLRKDIPLGDEMRPDKSGVILFGREIGDLMVIRAVPTQEKIPDAVFQYVCGLARAHNFPLVFSVFEQKNGKYVDHKRGLFASPAISAKLSAEDLEKI